MKEFWINLFLCKVLEHIVCGMDEMKEKRQKQVLKIVIFGAQDVGISAFIRQAIFHEFFEQNSKMRSNFEIKHIEKAKISYQLYLWRFICFQPYDFIKHIFFQNADAVILLFDLTRLESFSPAIEKMMKSIPESVKQIPLILVGNKVDLHSERMVLVQEAQEMANHINSSYREVSAKSGEGIEEVIELILSLVSK